MPSEIEGLTPEWRLAAHTAGATLYATPEWVLSLWESHFDKRNIDFVVCREAGHLCSVFPLHRRTFRKLGISFSQVELLTNNYGQNHNELACFPVNKCGVNRFLETLDLRAWDVAYLASIPVESATHCLLLEEATSRGHAVTVEPNVSAPYLPLPPDWETFLASKSANFRSDMRRKWQKATAAGLSVRLISDPSEALSSLATILRIEGRSWKESEGTSISAQQLPQKFYRAFLPRAAEVGWLRIYLVYLDGEPIAYDMGILLRGTYYMLKTSFVAEFAKVSPGVFLRQYVIRDLMELGGVTEHDFLGDADSYKLRWTSNLRPHSNLFIYNKRSIRALALHRAKLVRKRFWAPSTDSSQRSDLRANELNS